MRVVRYHELGEPGVLQVDEVDRPTPAADEVLVGMRAASVNPVDTMFRSGEYGDVTTPAIPGGDGAGTVVEVGADVDAFDVGDRVFASGMGHADGGTFAEYVAFPTIKLARLPGGVPFEVGGAVGNVGATAWTALEAIAGIATGDRVLVHGGAGGVGHVAVQIAASAGADVVATVGSDDVRDRVRELGATDALFYGSDTLADDVVAATGGAGVEVVLDHMLGEYLELDCEVLASGGQIVTIAGDIPPTGGAALRDKEITLRGMSLGNRTERSDILQRLARLLERGDLTAVVADTYEFEDVSQAHRDVLAGGYLGKLLVTP
ncbi:MAG: NADPH:quinone reductase [Halovenus sp.]